MKRLLPFLLIVFFPFSSIAQEVPSERITTEFFHLYSQYPMRAYAKLFERNPWMHGKRGLIETNRAKLRELTYDLGDYLGYELIAESRIGDNYLLKSFMVKYERQPVRFTFVLYRPSGSWQVQSMSFDNDLHKELKRSVKEDGLIKSGG